MSDATLQLPFDQYQRYRLVADILEDLRVDGERLAVLDVGGRTELLRKFLPNDEVFLVDVEESDAVGLVLGDGSRLPFADDAVDAVVCFDTLEHVPPPRRDAFLDEVLRVTRRWAVVAGPYDTKGVADAELLLEDFLHGKMGVEHRYLAEHKQNGLPSYEGSIARLRAGGAEVASIGHANLQRWLALMCAELYMDRDPQLRQLAAKYYEFYNATLYASDHSAPVYRHALVAAKDGAALPSVESLLGPAVAPSGVFEPVRGLLEQLMGYDVDREVVQAEWQRLEGVNADLHLDLEGHRETLAIVRQENEVQREVIHDLRERAIEILGNEDLLEEELEKRAIELERERLEGERQAAELRGDLQAHQTSLEELDGLLKSEREESRSVAHTLRVDLEAHQEFVARLKKSDEDQRARIAELDAQVALHVARGAELEGGLAERAAANEQLQASVEQLQASLEEAQAMVQMREQELAVLQADREAVVAERDDLVQQLHRANVTLGEKQGSLDKVRTELTNQRQALEALQRALGDRWANLLRALGLK